MKKMEEENTCILPLVLRNLALMFLDYEEN